MHTIGSSLIYGFATLRKIVHQHDKTYHKPTKGGLFGIFPERQQRPENLVDFNTPSLILTQKHDGSTEHIRNRVLQYDITPQDIMEFLKNNRHLLNEDKDGNLIFVPESGA